jgi:hypothetical protein
MKYSIIILLSLSVLIIATSCKQSTPCNECNDKALVKIDHKDATGPVFQWTISDIKTAGAQETSTTETITEGTQSIKNMGAGLSYNILVNATDNESGIKRLTLQGVYTFSCYNNDVANIGKGDLNKYAKVFDFDNCALKSWNLEDNHIERYANCPNAEFLNSDLTFLAVSENFAGKRDTSRVTVHFNPEGK